MFNLENGWIGSEDKECKGEIVGYCEECGEDIYENENFKKVDCVLICQKCNEKAYEIEEGMEDN